MVISLKFKKNRSSSVDDVKNITNWKLLAEICTVEIRIKLT